MNIFYLKLLMRELFDFFFNSGDKEFIRITSCGAILTNNRERYALSFHKTSLKFEINYLLDNSYFTLPSMCFCQLLEISVRSNPANSVALL